MKILETDYMKLTILNNKIVLVDVADGIEITKEKTQLGIAMVEKEMPGDYGVIINRKEDYSFIPVDVYSVHNSHPRMKAIALVIYDNRIVLPVATEQRLFKGKLEAFNSVKLAKEWIDSAVD